MYIGSVRFYKHVILLTMAAIVVGTWGWNLYLGSVQGQLKTANAALSLQVKTMEDQARAEAATKTTAEQQAKEAQAQIKEAVNAKAEPMAYQTMFPDLYVSEEDRKPHVPNTGKNAYLTYDDGPSARSTEILDALQEKDVKATFFVVYSDTDFGKNIYKRIATEGHTLAIHSASHDYKTIYRSVEDYLTDFEKLYTHLYKVTGVKVTIFRFPGGSLNSYNAGIYQEIIAEMTRRGFQYYDWNVGSADTAKNASKETVIDNVVHNAQNKDKAIVLMHDSQYKWHTAEAVYALIAHFKSQGYALKGLDNSVAPYTFAYKE